MNTPRTPVPHYPESPVLRSQSDTFLGAVSMMPAPKPIEYFRQVPCVVRCIDNVNFEGVLEIGGKYNVIGVYTLGRELFVDIEEGGGWSASRFSDAEPA